MKKYMLTIFLVLVFVLFSFLTTSSQQCESFKTTILCTDFPNDTASLIVVKLVETLEKVGVECLVTVNAAECEGFTISFASLRYPSDPKAVFWGVSFLWFNKNEMFPFCFSHYIGICKGIDDIPRTVLVILQLAKEDLTQINESFKKKNEEQPKEKEDKKIET